MGGDRRGRRERRERRTAASARRERRRPVPRPRRLTRPSLLPHRRPVVSSLALPLSYKDIKKADRQALVADALDRFHIVGKKDLFPSQLSGGQQQLVGVARAVIGNPKLLLADEPTGNLHSSQAEEIMELFKRLNDEGTTIVQVTHSEKNAEHGHRVVRLLDGWIVDEPAAHGASG